MLLENIKFGDVASGPFLIGLSTLEHMGGSRGYAEPTLALALAGWLADMLIGLVCRELEVGSVSELRGGDGSFSDEVLMTAAGRFMSLVPAREKIPFSESVLRTRLTAAAAAKAKPEEYGALTSESVMRAASRLDTMHAILRGAHGREACTLLHTLGRALTQPEGLSIAALGILESKLVHLRAVMIAAVEQPPEMRVATALEAIEERLAEERRGVRTQQDAAGSDKGGTHTGYGAVFRDTFLTRIMQPDHQSFTARLEEVLDARAHPHVAIGLILESAPIEYVHALLGQKDFVASLPLVKRVAEELRDHGPTFLGQVGDAPRVG